MVGKSILLVCASLVLSSCASSGFALLPKGSRERREERERERRYARMGRPEPVEEKIAAAPASAPVNTSAPFKPAASPAPEAVIAEFEPEIEKSLTKLEPIKIDEIEIPAPADSTLVFNGRTGTTATDDRSVLYLHEDHLELRTIAFAASFHKSTQYLRYSQIAHVAAEENLLNADLRIDTEAGIPVYYRSMPKEEARRVKRLIEERIKK